MNVLRFGRAMVVACFLSGFPWLPDAAAQVSAVAPPPVEVPTRSAPPLPSSSEVVAAPSGQRSDVFGASLFQGRFAQQSFRGFNPEHIISVGDRIDLKLWGAVDLAVILEVDAHGNIFVPRVGPTRVLGVQNAELNDLVGSRVREVYRDNVGVYASLATAEPVKVFVTGYVRAPGLYGAFASDSLLHFLDLAGGVDPQTGSFLDVRVLRGGQTVGRFNLYDFLIRGELPLFQFRDGDTIVVWPKKATARIGGLVRNPGQFEFVETVSVADLLKMAGADPRSTHVLLTRNQTSEREAEYLSVDADLDAVTVVSGDELEVFADRQVATIVARVEGEFSGLGQVTLPYGSTLADLLERVGTTERSDMDGLQLYRKSIAERQKQVLDEMLHKLEQAVLNARSGTREEAELRAREAELVLRFVERARAIEPQGRLVLHAGFDPRTVDLQDGDVLRIPRKVNTVAVQGEVFFPTSFVHREGQGVAYYLEQAGGLTQSGDANRIFLVRPSGEMREASQGWFARAEVQPGDELIVLPKVDTKNFQLTKDMVQVLYQIALSAGVVLSI
ncbi:MAG: SLBB domain-containing protein [Pseudomonadota bacterium]|nr:SLBB domain-containing protein [Pseudomonadota bacterium]